MYVQSNLYFLHQVLCAADFSEKVKIAPGKQGRLNRGTTLLLRTLANADSKAEKSSRGNGRNRCAYYRFSTQLAEGTSHGSRHCLAPTDNSLRHNPVLLYSAQTLLDYVYILSPYSRNVKGF